LLSTTSQLLSHHQSIEKKQAELYSALAEKYPQYSPVFKKLGDDNVKHMEMAQRAYREGVTDAFEVGFLADPLDTDNYRLREPTGDLAEAVRDMIMNEETVIRFCMDAASNSGNLLPDVPETFIRLVKRKKKSIEKLGEIK
jgi:hypothetical protein